jgi:hypothetical protein
VDEQPHDPRGEPGQVDALHVRDGLRAADGRQVALVAVPERRRAPSREPGADQLGGVAALLHGHRRDAGELRDPAVGSAHAHHVADREHLGMPRKREVGRDGHPPGAVALGAGQLAEPPGEV